MIKLDLKKELKEYYSTKPDKFTLVDVPKMNFLMIDGHGDPNTSQEYVDAIQTLYPVAYTLKFTSKKQLDKDFSVMPLEGLWWASDMSDFASVPKSDWHWTAMIMQPDHITKQMFEQAVADVKTKKNLVSIDKIRFEAYDEGRAAQVLYFGSYSDEGPTIQKLHDFIMTQGGKIDSHNKHHHEIYLNDPRKVDPSKVKTIIRQPY